MGVEGTRLEEYRQRQTVQRLRAELYDRADLTDERSTAIADELKQAEARLAELEAESAVAPKEPDVRVGTAAARAAGEEMMSAATTGLEAAARVRMPRVPTGIVHLLSAEREPLVTFTVTAAGNKSQRVRLASWVEGYSARCIDTLELPAGKTEERAHLPAFFHDRVAGVTELTRAALHVRVDILGENRDIEHESTHSIWLLARSSAFNKIRDPVTRAWVDLSRYYAAWVTPNAPQVLDLLRAAADLTAAKRMVGYQVDAAGVEEQVRAVFEALKAVGITYVNSVLSFGAGEGEYMQRVRLPRESLEDRAANCIDGTVLMASVLEAASLNPGIVFVPGHAFLAWEKSSASNEWDFVETTKIGSHDFAAACAQGRALANTWDAKPMSIAQLRADGITPME